MNTEVDSHVAVSEPDSRAQRIAALEDQYIKLLESKITAFTAVPNISGGSDATSLQEVTSLSKGTQSGIENEEHFHHELKSPVTDDDSDKNEEDGTRTQTKEQNDDKAEAFKATKGSRYNIVISKWVEKELCYKDFPADLSIERKHSDIVRNDTVEGGRAFTFKMLHSRHAISISNSERLLNCTIEIESQPLLNLMNSCMNFDYGRKDTISSPFEWFIWSWDALQASTTSQEDDSDEEKQARIDLDELLKVIRNRTEVEPLDDYFTKRKIYQKEKIITHQALWTIFPPGTVVCASIVFNEPQLFFVTDVAPSQRGQKYFMITCSCLDWDGTRFRLTPYELRIEYFKDKRSISTLAVYPLEYHKDEKSLKDLLIKRGRKYEIYCTAEQGNQMFSYNGLILSPQGGQVFRESDVNDSETTTNSSAQLEDHSSPRPSAVSGDVIIDFISFLNFQPSAPTMGTMTGSGGNLPRDYSGCSEKVEKLYRLSWHENPPDKSLTDEQLLFCPPRVLGYAIKPKKWAQLLVEAVSDPEQASDNIFKNLQLEEQSKTMIKNLVKAHEEGKGGRGGENKGIVDFVEDKGKGLVIVLYGLPGVGKTLTAEGVARLTRRPLFTIGVSDIGTTSHVIETKLALVFKLASIWKAVLLIDEADVFLEARDSSDNSLQRNSMVSVFLRILEYYEGILVLTTNRMRSFDIAVQSRVHLAVKYTDLTPDQREHIFLHFLNQLNESKQVENWDGRSGVKPYVKKLRQKPFNGRQIRNIVSSAMKLARASGEQLTPDHLEQVADATEAFQKDLSNQEAVYRASHVDRK